MSNSRNDPPSFLGEKPLKLVEMPVGAESARWLISPENSYLRLYLLGDCRVIVTRDYGEWHLSISHPSRYPTWHEICQARYRLLPKKATFAMLLPPEDKYINIHKSCFHLHELTTRLAEDHR